MKGLELAARDAARGVLTTEQKNDIRASVGGLDRGDGRPRRPAQRHRGEGGSGRAAPGPGAGGLAARRHGAVRRRAQLRRRVRLRDPGPAPGQARDRHAGGAVLRRGAGADRCVRAGPGPAVCIVSMAISGEPTHLRRLADAPAAQAPGGPASSSASGRRTMPASTRRPGAGRWRPTSTCRPSRPPWRPSWPPRTATRSPADDSARGRAGIRPGPADAGVTTRFWA